MSVWRKPRLVPSPHRIAAVTCREDYEGLLTLERYGVPVKRFYATEQEMIEIGHAS